MALQIVRKLLEALPLSSVPHGAKVAAIAASMGAFAVAVFSVLLGLALKDYAKAVQFRDATEMHHRIFAAHDALAVEVARAEAYVNQVWQDTSAQDAAIGAPQKPTQAHAQLTSAMTAAMAVTDQRLAHAGNFVLQHSDIQTLISLEKHLPSPVVPSFGVRATRDAALTAEGDNWRSWAKQSTDSALQDLNTEGLNLWPNQKAQEITYLGALGFEALGALRSQLTPTLRVTPQLLLEGYRAAELRLLRLALSVASRVSQRNHFDAVATSFCASVAGENAERVFKLGSQLLNKTHLASLLSSGQLAGTVKDFFAAVHAMEYLIEEIVTPLLTEKQRVGFWLREGAGNIHNVTRSLATRVRERVMQVSPTYAFDAAVGQAAPKQISDVSAALRAFVDESEPAVSIAFVVTASVGLVIAVVTLIGSAVAMWWELKKSESVAREAKRDAVVREVLVRVQEVASAIRTFTLDPPPTPESLRGTSVARIEATLQRCVASLKAIAPALPAMMFPARSVKAAEHYCDVRQQDEAHEVQTTVRDMAGIEPSILSLQEVASVRLNASISDIVAPGAEEVDAAFVFVDVAGLHRFDTSTDALKVAAEFYPQLLEIVEQETVLHGGIVFSVSGDRFVSVWNVPTPCPAPCEAAARTALTIAARLSLLRREHKRLAERLVPRIGVTAGPVTFGVFGGETVKTVQLFGRPLLVAAAVAAANGPHQTVVAVDDVVRSRIEPGLPCKPIEVLDGGYKVHELIPLVRQRETDLSSRLAEYKRAFALFEKKYYAEALKAFRRYTKQYGYDSSVERIQSLITGA